MKKASQVLLESFKTSLNEVKTVSEKEGFKKIDTITGVVAGDGLVYSREAREKYDMYQGEIIFEDDYTKLPEEGSKVNLDVYEIPEDKREAYGDTKYWFEVSKELVKEEAKLKESSLFKSFINNLNESVNIDTLPKPTNKTSFEGFDISKISDTDSSYKQYQEFLENPDLAKEKGFTSVYIAEITPQEYMDLCSLYIAKNSETDLNKLSDLNGMQKHFAERAHEIADAMKQGEKVPLPILDFHWKEQDGRHRAVAAYINEYSTIPCLICY